MVRDKDVAAEKELTGDIDLLKGIDLAGEDASSKKALVPFEPLQRYLAEIRRYPLLSREEEHRLAVEYKEFGNIEAAYRLVTANLRLVVMIARELRHTAMRGEVIHRHVHR